jgi:two-component system chemotaxis response regulator CheB
MGEDGARGLLSIHCNGGQTLGQDEATCAVFRMPRAAQLVGAVTDLLPLEQIAGAIKRAVLGALL